MCRFVTHPRDAHRSQQSGQLKRGQYHQRVMGSVPTASRSVEHCWPIAERSAPSPRRPAPAACVAVPIGRRGKGVGVPFCDAARLRSTSAR